MNISTVKELEVLRMKYTAKALADVGNTSGQTYIKCYRDQQGYQEKAAT